MTGFAADQAEFIAMRLKQIEKETRERVSGEKPPEVGEVAIAWPCLAPSEFNDAARQYLAGDFDPA